MPLLRAKDAELTRILIVQGFAERSILIRIVALSAHILDWLDVHVDVQ
jgi:hypothetical protein